MNAAVRLHVIAHRLLRTPVVGRLLSKLVYWLSRSLTLADIDPAADLDPTVVIPHGSGVVIGETARVGARTRIMPGVVIGAREWTERRRHATIGSDVFIGAGAKVLGSVVVGDGARIGANAVVVRDVAAGSTVLGVPAVPHECGDKSSSEQDARPGLSSEPGV